MLYIWLFLSCQAHRLREVTKTEGRHPFHLKGQYSLLAADWSSPGMPHKAYPNGLAAASTCQPEICTSVLCDSNSWSYYTPQQCSCPITATQPCPAVITPTACTHTHSLITIICKWNSHFQGERKKRQWWGWELGWGCFIRMGAGWLWGYNDLMLILPDRVSLWILAPNTATSYPTL